MPGAESRPLTRLRVLGAFTFPSALSREGWNRTILNTGIAGNPISAYAKSPRRESRVCEESLAIPADANSAKGNRRSLDCARDDNRFRGCLGAGVDARSRAGFPPLQAKTQLTPSVRPRSGQVAPAFHPNATLSF